MSDRGLIFISIDDNEYANLKLLCDSIFGESNFVTTCVWQKIHSIKNDAKYLSVNHDYVLIYAKRIENINIHLLKRTDEMNARYKNPDNDPRGAWQSGDLVANETRTNGNYDVVGPTGKVFNVPDGKHWVYSEDNMKELIADKRIWFGKDGTSFPRKKRFLSEVQDGRTPDTWWKNEEVGHNQEGARDLKKVLGAISFNNPIEAKRNNHKKGLREYEVVDSVYKYFRDIYTGEKNFDKKLFVNLGFCLGLPLPHLERLLEYNGYSISQKSQRKFDQIIRRAFKCGFSRDMTIGLIDIEKAKGYNIPNLTSNSKEK